MIYISRHGNLTGPFDKTPKLKKISTALEKGFDVEINIRYEKQDGFTIGNPRHSVKVEKEFLIDNQKNLWCHCKNLKALSECLVLGLNCFSSEFDDYSLTSKLFIWGYPGKIIPGGILVLPELLNQFPTTIKIAGICSNDIEKYKLLVETKENEKE